MNSRKQPPLASDSHKRHVKERLFRDYAAPTQKPRSQVVQVGRAQRAWSSWEQQDRIRILVDYCEVPRNQTHLFYALPWYALSLYLKRRIKDFMRKSISSAHPLSDLRYRE